LTKFFEIERFTESPEFKSLHGGLRLTIAHENTFSIVDKGRYNIGRVPAWRQLMNITWDIILGAVAASAQFLAAWLGWQVTIKPIGKHDVKRRKVYKSLFLAAGILGVVASIGIAARSEDAGRKLAIAIGVSRPNLIPGSKDGYVYSFVAPTAGKQLRSMLTKRNTGLSSAAIKHFDLIETYDAATDPQDVCQTLEQHLYDLAQSGTTPQKSIVSGGDDFVINFLGRTLTEDDVKGIKDGRLGVFIATYYTYKDPDGRNPVFWRTRKQLSGNIGECGGKPWNLDWRQIDDRFR